MLYITGFVHNLQSNYLLHIISAKRNYTEQIHDKIWRERDNLKISLVTGNTERQKKDLREK